jgi:hypothetical protein
MFNSLNAIQELLVTEKKRAVAILFERFCQIVAHVAGKCQSSLHLIAKGTEFFRNVSVT